MSFITSSDHGCQRKCFPLYFNCIYYEQFSLLFKESFLFISKCENAKCSCYVGEGQIYKQRCVLKMMIFVTKYLIVQRHNLPYDWKQTRRLPIFVMIVLCDI